MTIAVDWDIKSQTKQSEYIYVHLLKLLIVISYPFVYGKPLNRYLNWQSVEHPDKMPHNAAFHQGLHCLL